MDAMDGPKETALQRMIKTREVAGMEESKTSIAPEAKPDPIEGFWKCTVNQK